MRKIFTFIAAALFATGLWADTWTAAEIVANSGAGTAKNHVTVSSPGVTAVTNATYAKINNVSVTRDGVEIDGTATSGSLVETKILSIKVERGYKLVSPVKVNGHSSSTSDPKMAYVGWEKTPGQTFQLCNGATEWKLPKNSATSEPSDKDITFSTPIRTIYLYKKIKTANDSYNSFGTSKTVGSGTKAYVATVQASAVLAPEIEGISQIWNDETITLTGYPTGGTWAVVSGPGAITADGVLTANGNGTIKVSYTYDEVSETKDIVAAETKDFTWTFNTKDVLPTTQGITAVNVGGTFESGGQLKLGTNGNYAYIDLSSTNLVVTKAVINAKTGSAGSGKNIAYGSSASTVQDGVTPDATSTNYTDYEITPSSLSQVFSVIKASGTSAYISSITLTVKKAVKHTISFNSDGGSEVTSIEVVDGAAAAKPADPTKDGYAFAGWYNGENAYDWTSVVTSDLTLTAHWNKLYTVTYAAGEGTGSMDGETHIAGVEVTLPACTFTAPEGKEFEAWSSSDVTISAGKFIMPAKDVTITATWMAEIARFKVAYYDGETKLGVETVEVGKHPTATGITLPKKEFKIFAAWQKDNADIELSTVAGAKNDSITLFTRYELIYSQSINIEQLVLDNGKSYGIADALVAKGFGYVDIDQLDSLDDSKSKRNEPYMGLKIKKTTSSISIRLAAGSTLKVKFGNVGANVNVKVGDADPVAKTADNLETPYEYTNATEAAIIVRFLSTSTSTVVFKQIMINEDIQTVVLNARIRVDGETANGAVGFAGDKLVYPVGTEITLTNIPEDGYVLEAYDVYKNGDSTTKVTVSEGKFIMPNYNVVISGTFKKDSGTALDNTDASVKAVKVLRDGQLLIIKNGVTYTLTGAVVK